MKYVCLLMLVPKVRSRRNKSRGPGSLPGGQLPSACVATHASRIASWHGRVPAQRHTRPCLLCIRGAGVGGAASGGEGNAWCSHRIVCRGQTRAPKDRTIGTHAVPVLASCVSRHGCSPAHGHKQCSVPGGHVLLPPTCSCIS